MAKTTLFKGVVYLSDDNYAKLVKDGVIEVGGQTITYDESMVYITPKALPTDYYTKSEVEEKLSQTISKPLIAPTATELVAVDNTNSQTMLAIGDGLSVEDGTLKASGGGSSGGSGGGIKLYQHIITIFSGSLSGNIVMSFISSSPTAISSYSAIARHLYNLGFTGPASGDVTNTSGYPCSPIPFSEQLAIMIYSSTGSDLNLFGTYNGREFLDESSIVTINDKIVEL